MSCRVHIAATPRSRRHNDPRRPLDRDRTALGLDQRIQIGLPAQLACQLAATGVAIALVEYIAPILPLVDAQLEAEAVPQPADGPGGLPVDQQAWGGRRGLADQTRERLHHQRCPEHNQQITFLQVLRMQAQKSLRQLLPKEHDLRLHQITLLFSQGLPPILALLHSALQLLDWHFDLRHCVNHMRSVKVAMRGHDCILGKSGQVLQRVYVLGVASQQQAFLIQEPDEVVARRRLIVAGPHLAAQLVERSGPLLEIAQLKDGLRAGEVVLLQVVVQPCARRAEVRDPRRCRNPGAAHNDDVLHLLLCDMTHDALQVERLQNGFLPLV
mmetsp:Transcript_68816/g.192985  ORF Transcript_68816/g.192985 Transcript_68816/m.192985 type:complete len:327 (+) Transcript_68816:206-1186(+)